MKSFRATAVAAAAAWVTMTTAIGTFAASEEKSTSPYSGQERRSIKSLGEQEIAGLLAGQGAGFAKAAELNGYPGPLHTLELAGKLGLDSAQVRATDRLLEDHKARARELGAALVESERKLDRLFADRQASADAIEHATRLVGELQARLRAEHLKTHLTQTALLSAAQVRRYSELRGYGEPGSEAIPPAGNPDGHGAGHKH